MQSQQRHLEVVVIDDDEELSELLVSFYGQEFKATAFHSGREGIDYIAAAENVGLILCDLKLPDLSGLDVIRELKQEGVRAPLVMITAHADKQTAIEAIQLGAYDYITKPLEFADLKVVTDRAIKFFNLHEEHKRLQEKVKEKHSFGELLGKSKKMQDLFMLIEKVGKSPSNVLITGESGSGKEMVARAIHFQGARKDKAFVAVNCSAIPKDLLESELFGHKKGSFTGATDNRTGLFVEASGGTIFLDEIGDMPLDMQVKILRAIQEKKIRPVGGNQDEPVDVRVIAATHRDLSSMVQEGDFREDLYYRLNVIPVKVPPLRERKEDILLLANHFLTKYQSYNPEVEGFSKESEEKLLRLRWTGNVRELENAIERAVSLCSDKQISEQDVSVEMDLMNDNQLNSLFTKLPTLKQLEKEYIQYVLINNDNKKEESAKVLGINRKTLYRKEKEYDL